MTGFEHAPPQTLPVIQQRKGLQRFSVSTEYWPGLIRAEDIGNWAVEAVGVVCCCVGGAAFARVGGDVVRVV